MDIESFYEAKKHYEARGYKYVDLPWHTSQVYQAFTLPEGREACQLRMHDAHLLLVGSAEQAFIEFFPKLADGFYYAITPCFRNEPKFDDEHQRYFMKLELLHKGSDNYARLLDDAEDFFKKYLRVYPKCIYTTSVGGLDSPTSYDICSCNGDIELGSYGSRVIQDVLYSYGTGLAQPRLNYAIANQS